MGDSQLKLVYSSESIQERIKVLAQQINTDFQGHKLVVVCVLKGAFMFFADLVRRLTITPEIDFIRVASYGGQTESSGEIRLIKDLENSLKSKHVLLVEDVVDSGNSLDFLHKELSARGPESITTCALVDKRERRSVEVSVEYAGFILDQGFIVGYGMDFAEQFRELDAIYEIVENG